MQSIENKIKHVLKQNENNMFWTLVQNKTKTYSVKVGVGVVLADGELRGLGGGGDLLGGWATLARFAWEDDQLKVVKIE